MWSLVYIGIFRGGKIKRSLNKFKIALNRPIFSFSTKIYEKLERRISLKTADSRECKN
jgi:hypothetical protein